MKKIKITKRMVSLTGILALSMTLFSGCGSTSSDSSSASTKSSTDGGKTKVVIALDNAVPYAYLDEDGNPAGCDVDCLNAIFEELPQYEVEYVGAGYEAAPVGLESGKYDIEAGCKGYTDERAEKFLITDSSFYWPLNLCVAAGSDINGLEDMDGKTLAPFPTSDSGYKIYQDWCKAHPDVNVIMEPSSSLLSAYDRLNMVAEGEYDGYMDPPDYFEPVLDENPDLKSKIKVIEEPVAVAGGHFLINKNDTKLYEDVNAKLNEIKESGKLDDVYEASKDVGYRNIEKYKDVALD